MTWKLAQVCRIPVWFWLYISLRKYRGETKQKIVFQALDAYYLDEKMLRDPVPHFLLLANFVATENKNLHLEIRLTDIDNGGRWNSVDNTWLHFTNIQKKVYKYISHN